jgi:pre-mRNA-splicing factor RBM22/SLT11
MVYGVPVGVRDKLLANQNSVQQHSLTTSDVGTAFYYQSQALMMQHGADSNSIVPIGIHNLPQARQLNQFSNTLYNNAEHGKTAFRNLPKLCSFWLIGTCTRVMKKACPFRPCCGEYVFPEIAGSHKSLHAKLVEDLKAQGPVAVMQNLDSETRDAIKNTGKGVNREEAIRKRVNGDDDLTRKYIGKMKNMNLELPTPEDESITTLWLGNVEQDMTESDLRDVLYAYGQITGIHIVRSSKCAFVEYASREMAEFAATQLYNALMIKGRSVTVNWAKPKAPPSSTNNLKAAVVMPAPPGMENQSVSSYALPGMSLPILQAPMISNEDDVADTSKKRKSTDELIQPSKISYSSMSSTRLGSKN